MGSLFGGGGGSSQAAPAPQIIYVPQVQYLPAPAAAAPVTTPTPSTAGLTSASQQQVASNLAGNPDGSTQGFSNAVAASTNPTPNQTTLLGG